MLTAISSSATPNVREQVINDLPCVFIKGLLKACPEIVVDQQGRISRSSLIDALRSRGYTKLVCKILNDFGLKRASGADSDWFTVKQLMETPFFDGFATLLGRTATPDARLDDVTQGAKKNKFGAHATAYMVRDVAAEQRAKGEKVSLGQQFVTIFEYSALRSALVGSGPLDLGTLRDAKNQVLTERALDPNVTKGFPGILLNSLAAGAFFAMQSTINLVSFGRAYAPHAIGARAAGCPLGHTKPDTGAAAKTEDKAA